MTLFAELGRLYLRRNAYRTVVEKLRGKKEFWRPRHRSEDVSLRNML
jgi:hypothetical protein